MSGTVTILSFSPIYRDARVLRQIDRLHEEHPLQVIGFGDPHPAYRDDPRVSWHRLDPTTEGTSAAPDLAPPTRALRRIAPRPIRSVGRRAVILGRRAFRAGLLGVGGRITATVPHRTFWRDPTRRQALEILRSTHTEVILANDWDGLVVGAEAARSTNSALIYDAHEYAPLEWANRLGWRFTDAPIRRWALRSTVSEVTASMTVSPGIADRLATEYGLDPVVVLNTPALSRSQADADPRGDDLIRIVHHGGASPDRRPEAMIEAVAAADGRFTLDLMLLGDQRYIDRLQRFAARTAGDRVRFRQPVATEEIVPTLRTYDLGFYLLPPTNFNHRVALPNKLFDFIAAGLAICVGPTGSMAELVRERGCGVVTPSFRPADVAATLDSLGTEALGRMKAASQMAAKADLNADAQLAKVAELVRRAMLDRDRSGSPD